MGHKAVGKLAIRLVCGDAWEILGRMEESLPVSVSALFGPSWIRSLCKTLLQYSLFRHRTAGGTRSSEENSRILSGMFGVWASYRGGPIGSTGTPSRASFPWSLRDIRPMGACNLSKSKRRYAWRAFRYDYRSVETSIGTWLRWRAQVHCNQS